MICARKDGDDSVTQPIESADRIRQPINKRPKPMKNQVQNDELGWTKSLADITGHLCACVCVTCVCVCVCVKRTLIDHSTAMKGLVAWPRPHLDSPPPHASAISDHVQEIHSFSTPFCNPMAAILESRDFHQSKNSAKFFKKSAAPAAIYGRVNQLPNFICISSDRNRNGRHFWKRIQTGGRGRVEEWGGGTCWRQQRIIYISATADETRLR